MITTKLACCEFCGMVTEVSVFENGAESVFIYCETCKLRRYHLFIAPLKVASKPTKAAVKWTQCKDALPTEADADEFGDIFWCGKTSVRRLALIEALSWDFTKEWNLNGYWARTGYRYPAGPEIK